ncbi:NAD-dependent epimerase/dehydratase family protein [Mesorhizobium sp. INR15]|uniref:NAD-dependent epimerase/dehydratase family protein n=1 Tax=Mesorhizobium sp. INR15 TaxID=2654248 RepID=UPI0018967E5D|nr:NAD-dependent epimerase/dehydratase family protein [Mesorhizobium sp. INR15]QPC94094.1 NAD-dependent epimerase/dehydratase family protein [Mesorhizobium sp. INR15]
MKVLVTGATGFIGRHVVECLRNAGMAVRIASRHPEMLGTGGETVSLPSFDAPAEAFLAITRDMTHVVHCAGLNNDRGDATEAAYRATNAQLSARLADAAAKQTSRRFIYLSSIRAAIGARVSGTIDEETLHAPQCSYGRSKREGEIGILEAYESHRRSDAAVLRLPPVYGAGMKGNLVTLMRLADTPLPLPSGALTGVRSLISAEATARAVLHLLTHSGPLRPVYVASNVPPMSVAGIIGAFRTGFKRPTRLIAVHAGLMRPAAALLGKRDFWDSLTASQICDPSLLVSGGWSPDTDTAERLSDMARLSKSAQPR